VRRAEEGRRTVFSTQEERMTRKDQDIDLVVAVIGLKGAGKDVLCQRLAEKGFATYRFSDPIRAEAVRRGIPDYTVAQLQDIGDEGRRAGGTGHWARKLLELARENGHRTITVNGSRNPGEIEALRAEAGNRCVLVGIVAPWHIRFARIAKRGQIEDRAELESFLAMDDRDRGIGQPPEGQQVDRCLAMVPWENLYDNEGPIQEYLAWIDALHARLSAPRPLEWAGEFGGGDD
jgi:dephospho-CoA kinase